MSIGRTRDAAQRLVEAHLALLKAELAVTGREIGIVVGMAVAALALLLLMVGLIYTGAFLFIGEWWFGSIGWGVLHGSLFTIALVVPIGLNLAGGWVGAWVRGLLVGIVVTVGFSVLFASNVLRDAAVSAGDQLEASLALEPALLPTLVGLVAGALVFGLVLFIVGLRMGGAFRMLVAGALVGAFVGAILGSVTFDTKGAIALAWTIGLVAWIALSGLLAARHGFDPEQRYDALVPRQSIAAAESTKVFLVKQWERQRKKMVGR
jgi:hypothetical protein